MDSFNTNWRYLYGTLLHEESKCFTRVSGGLCYAASGSCYCNKLGLRKNSNDQTVCVDQLKDLLIWFESYKRVVYILMSVYKITRQSNTIW